MHSTATCRKIQNKEHKLDFFIFHFFGFYLYAKKSESNPELSRSKRN